jgi:MscS family membrane protein
MMEMTEISMLGLPRAMVINTLFCLIFVLFTPPAFSKNSKPDLDPLRPANTSSPRATLNSFIADSRQFIDDNRNNKVSEKTFRAFRRASQTLDYSITPDGDSWFVRIRRMVLLQELLARIELPADNEIPGSAEVADGTVTEWTIPNTSITITKIAQGPRAGQFLFSADTVQRLDSLYRQAKELPYKPGATAGVYEDMVGADSSAYTQELQLRNRLKPADTSSPRITLEGFLQSVNVAYKLVTEANQALMATPPRLTRAQAREKEVMALNLLERASETLDLSHVPEALRADVSIETVLQLKEILDRMLLPPIDAVPDIKTVTLARKDANGVASQIATPFRWRFPNAPIEIVGITEGERQGQFLFSSSTVKRIGGIYQKIKDLPYRREQFGGTELEYQSPGLSPGFYEDYVASSGYLIPQAHWLSRFIDNLPDGFKTIYAGQMLWQWFGLLFGILVTLAVAYFAYRYIRLSAKHLKSPLRDWLKVLAAVIVLIIVIVFSAFFDEGLNFTGNIQAIVTTVVELTIFVLTAWTAFVLCQALAEALIATPRLRDQSSEAALVRIGAWLLGFIIAAWIIIDGIRSLGADLIPLLAGLGIGGLAVALAAQSTIANFIGGLILLANKPIRVGDFCRYGEDPSADWLRIGTIEEINWISTRIRGIDRTVTTIPNAEFANMHIVNLTKRDQRLVRTSLQLRYETNSEQLRYILIKLRELLLGHPMVTPDPARVRFVGYGAYSKDVEIFCYLRCTEHNEFLAIQEDLFLRMEEIINKAGSGFAFPSQTAYLARDGGLNKENKAEAETEVGHLRFTSKLPFPEFDEEERERLEDILDYPPKGSPDYEQREEASEPKTGK